MIQQDARILTLQDARLILGMLPSKVSRSQNYWELGDCDGPSPYQQTLDELDALIGYAKQIRAELQILKNHAHEWNDDQYCVICGADGAT